MSELSPVTLYHNKVHPIQCRGVGPVNLRVQKIRGGSTLSISAEPGKGDPGEAVALKGMTVIIGWLRLQRVEHRVCNRTSVKGVSEPDMVIVPGGIVYLEALLKVVSAFQGWPTA